MPSFKLVISSWEIIQDGQIDIPHFFTLNFCRFGDVAMYIVSGNRLKGTFIVKFRIHLGLAILIGASPKDFVMSRLFPSVGHTLKAKQILVFA